jgi:hypothetical protein
LNKPPEVPVQLVSETGRERLEEKEKETTMRKLLVALVVALAAPFVLPATVMAEEGDAPAKKGKVAKKKGDAKKAPAKKGGKKAKGDEGAAE